MEKIDETEIVRRFKAISKFKLTPEVTSRDLERVKRTLTGQPTEKPTSRQEIWKTIMEGRLTKLAAAAAIILVVMLALHAFLGDGTKIAFGEILENLRYVQTLHATLHKNGKEAEVWAKRPNMLRMEYDNGTYEISNGAEWWIVDEKNNKATKKPSWYFKHAQRRGLDVLDFLFQAASADDFSGFFSEEPVEQIEQDGKIFDLYQMQTASSGAIVEFEALVDAETHFVHSMSLEMREQDEVTNSIELSVLEYDQPVPENIFVFEPPHTMEVTIEEPDTPEPEPEQIEGATLSGRITWASSSKPVAGARLAAAVLGYDPNGRYQRSLSFEAHTETDREGYWSVNGVPAGRVDLRVRSWELEWPAAPTFTTNVGSPEVAMIVVDGASDFQGLDFKVYRPKDFFARITMTVTDEDGNPVEGAAGSIRYDEYTGGLPRHQHLYARPHQQRTGPDGIFDARDIWPSTRPVRVSVGAGPPYVRGGVSTGPFVIRPKESYQFDLVLQRSAQMKIQVVDLEHKPLEGLSVMVLDAQWLPFPAGWPEELVFTDSDGLVEVDGMSPAEDVIIAVRRVGPEAGQHRKFAYHRKTFASLFIPAVAPSGPDEPARRVVFDERPISIEGSCDSSFRPQKHLIFVMPAGVPRYRGVVFYFLRADFDDEGRFLLEGVPAGDIHLLCLDVSDGIRAVAVAEQSVHTEPGNTYVVKVSSRGLELIGQKPNI